MPEHKKVKYLLLDIEPECGECIYYHRIMQKHYDTCECTKMNIEVMYFDEACNKFKSKRGIRGIWE